GWTKYLPPKPVPPERKPTLKKTPIPKGLRRQVYERDYYECRYCGARRGLTIDHVVPESRGGKTTLENLVTCCKSCNSRKSARTPEEACMELRRIEEYPNGRV